MIGELKNISSLLRIGFSILKLKNSDLEKKNTVAAKVAQLLSENSGFLLKVGQYLGSAPDAHEEFANLVSRDGIAPLDYEVIKSILEFEYQLSTNVLFRNINEIGHLASISQVHQATSLSGQKMALKIKLPNIETEMQTWMSTLKLLPNMGPVKKWQVEIEEFKSAVSVALNEELNFTHEVEKLKKLNQLCNEDDWLMAPAPIEIFCTQNIIGMEWVEGQSFDILLKESAIIKKKYAELLVRFFIQSLFDWHFVQTDPNPGNFLFKDNQIVLLDAASFSEISSEQASVIAQLFCNEILNEDEIMIMLQKLNFTDYKLIKIKDKLPALLNILTEPFRTNSYNIKNWNSKSRIDELLGEDKWWFRSSGPAELFSLMRSFGLFARLIGSLDVSIDWKEITLKQAKYSKQSEITVVNSSRPIHFNIINKRFLEINVCNENGEELANVKMPIHEDTKFHEIIPVEISDKLNTSSDDIAKYDFEIQSRNDLPFTLFQAKTPNRIVKIDVTNIF